MIFFIFGMNTFNKIIEIQKLIQKGDNGAFVNEAF